MKRALSLIAVLAASTGLARAEDWARVEKASDLVHQATGRLERLDRPCQTCLGQALEAEMLDRFFLVHVAKDSSCPNAMERASRNGWFNPGAYAITKRDAGWTKAVVDEHLDRLLSQENAVGTYVFRNAIVDFDSATLGRLRRLKDKGTSVIFIVCEELTS